MKAVDQNKTWLSTKSHLKLYIKDVKSGNNHTCQVDAIVIHHAEQDWLEVVKNSNQSYVLRIARNSFNKDLLEFLSEEEYLTVIDAYFKGNAREFKGKARIKKVEKKGSYMHLILQSV